MMKKKSMRKMRGGGKVKMMRGGSVKKAMRGGGTVKMMRGGSVKGRK